MSSFPSCDSVMLLLNLTNDKSAIQIPPSLSHIPQILLPGYFAVPAFADFPALHLWTFAVRARKVRSEVWHQDKGPTGGSVHSELAKVWLVHCLTWKKHTVCLRMRDPQNGWLRFGATLPPTQRGKPPTNTYRILNEAGGCCAESDWRTRK